MERALRGRGRFALVGMLLALVLPAVGGATAVASPLAHSAHAKRAHAQEYNVGCPNFFANIPFGTALPNGQTIYQAWVEYVCSGTPSSLRAYVCLQSSRMGGPWSGCGGTYNPQVISTPTSDSGYAFAGTFSCYPGARYRSQVAVYLNGINPVRMDVGPSAVLC